ncbi:MAG: phage portal protein [Luteimonas sp.]
MAMLTKSAGLADTGFWDRLWSRVSGRPRLSEGERAHPFDVHTTPSGSGVSAESALRLSAVWGCVGLRSATVSSLPLHVRDNQKRLVKDEPLYRLLHDAPNADMTSSEWLEMQIASVDLWGNGYSMIEREGKRIVSLIPLAPDRVTMRRRSDGHLVYELQKKGSTEEISADDILHFKGFTLDGLIGLSPIQYAAETMGGLMDANLAASREWRNGLKVGGFLKTGAQTLTVDQRDRLRTSLGNFGLAENAGKWMVLEAGLEPASSQGIRMNPHDAQLLESRYFGIEEICRAFRVPPPLIGHTDKASSWASSLDGLNRGFLTYSLRPTLVRMEQAMRRKLMTPEERQRFEIRFAFEGMLRADVAARASFYSTMLQNGVFSRNYVRGLEELPDVEGGDELTVQLNLTPLDQLGDGNAAPVPKKETT